MNRSGQPLLAALALVITLGFSALGALAQSPPAVLAELFAELQSAADTNAARAIERRIWRLWFESGDEHIDQRMIAAADATRRQDFETAEQILTEIVTLAPEFPEGWNQRATVRWMANDYDGSLEDVAATLALEPRHFGALSGRAVILLAREDNPGALEALGAAIEVYPHFQGRWKYEELLEEQ